MKEFKTIEEQINILKSKGIIINNQKKAYKILLNNNYYNIINGYKDIFLNDNKYIKNTSFEEIYSMYEFDRSLRNIFLEYILKIENQIRSLIAYYFSKYHGNKNYLIIDNFETFKYTNVPIKTKEKQVKHIQSLIGNINKKKLGVQ